MILLSQLAQFDQDARYTLRQLRRNPFFSLTGSRHLAPARRAGNLDATETLKAT